MAPSCWNMQPCVWRLADPALRSQRVGIRSLFGVAAVARRAGFALTPHALRLLWSGLVLLLVLASCLSDWF
jgi:hypothetical protein